MKNASITLESSKTDSPKTPGGISKSLLTPCRRIGLSRKFRKSGILPFQSPLSSKTEVKREEVETRKRKESLKESSQTSENNNDCGLSSEAVQTPTRNIKLPCRKKSKYLLASISKCSEESSNDKLEVKVNESIPTDTATKQDVFNEEVTATLCLKSKSRSKENTVPSKSISKKLSTTKVVKANLDTVTVNEGKDIVSQSEKSEERSPNNLTKECIVVIQKKFFKKEMKVVSPECNEMHVDILPKVKDTDSEAVYDSDDTPLINWNNRDADKTAAVNTIDENENLESIKVKIAKFKKSKMKTAASTKTKNSSRLAKTDKQSSEDEDDDFETKRTNLIRNNYDKVIKPQKAKSTGSITQKDIDDMQSRIQIKKKMLLARAMHDDTKELKDLIKKWQKGCQDALMELMDLMKSKFPDKQNMDYSEILQTLNIPASVVGYDLDNDCFLTPDNESIILANV